MATLSPPIPAACRSLKSLLSDNRERLIRDLERFHTRSLYVHARLLLLRSRVYQKAQDTLAIVLGANVWAKLRFTNSLLMLVVFALHAWRGSEQALRLALAAQMLVFLARSVYFLRIYRNLWMLLAMLWQAGILLSLASVHRCPACVQLYAAMCTWPMLQSLICALQTAKEMYWFLVTSLAIILATGMVLFALLPSTILSSGPTMDRASAADALDTPGRQQIENQYHFSSFGSVLLELFSIMMGTDYDSYNAVTLRPGELQSESVVHAILIQRSFNCNC